MAQRPGLMTLTQNLTGILQTAFLGTMHYEQSAHANSGKEDQKLSAHQK
jgi:hypothetical protein